MTAKNGRQEPYPVWHFKNIKERGVWGGVVRASAPLGEPLALYPRRCSKRRGPAGPPNAQAPFPANRKCQLPTLTCLGPNVKSDSPLPESGRSGLVLNVCF